MPSRLKQTCLCVSVENREGEDWEVYNFSGKKLGVKAIYDGGGSTASIHGRKRKNKSCGGCG